MTTKNHGAGFSLFKTRIEEMTASLGGNEHVRTAVAWQMKDALTRVLEQRLGKGKSRHFSLPYGIEWTFAEDKDFERAYEDVSTLFCRKRTERKAVRSAPWRGALLVQRQLSVFLEGEIGDFALACAMAGSPREVRDRHSNEVTGEDWDVFVTDTGKYCISGSTFIGSSKQPTATHAKSAAGADKSLVRIVKTFFEADLVPIDDGQKQAG